MISTIEISIWSGVISCVVFSIFGFAIGQLTANIGLRRHIKKLDKLEKDYMKGWRPDNVCEHCFEGRYIPVLTKGQNGGLYHNDHMWACEKCHKCPSAQWIKHRGKM